MSFEEIIKLPIAVQLALGSGYLGYVTAYAGLRRSRTATDAIFMTVAFGLPAVLVFVGLEAKGVIVAALAGAVAAICVACLWRIGGRSASYWALDKAGVHNDDGLSHAWDALIQRRGLKSSQMSVHTKDGRILYMSDRTEVLDAPFGGLLLGADGSIVMVVQKERLADGTVEERTGVTDADWGARLTYIPADQIARVNIRIA